MKPFAILLLVWIAFPFAAHSQTETPKWKTQFSVRSMISGYWYKTYGFNFRGVQTKSAFSFGIRGGKSLGIAPGLRLFFGLGYMQFASRTRVDIALTLPTTDPLDSIYGETIRRRPILTWTEHLHLIDVPIRLDYYTDPTEKGWVVGFGLTPSILFGRRWSYDYDGNLSSGFEYYFPPGFIDLSGELQAGRTWTLGSHYTLDTRIVGFSDFIPRQNVTARRMGLGLQVLVQW